MDTRKTKKPFFSRPVTLYTVSALLPIFLMLIVYDLLGQWPFGMKGLYAFPDSYSQYTNYYEYLKTIGLNGVLYSFSRTLGGDLVGYFTYYMLSPFNLLFLIFPGVAAGKLMTVITLLKIGSCGLTFSIFLNHGRRFSYSTFLFSTSYAMMSYLMIYSQNMNFMDAVVLLPLMMLGIRSLVQERKYLLYCLSLAAALMINYYLGYMLCIFSVLYFIYEMILMHSLHKGDVLRRTGIFCVASLLSGGLSSVTLLPALCALSGGRGPGDLKGLLHFTSQFRTLDFLSRLNIGAYSWSDVSSNLPNIYCGMIMLALCILFFCSRQICLKEKLASGIFLLMMFFSCKLYFFNTVWHCFNEPHGSPVRYSFMISCLVILFAFRYYKATIRPANLHLSSTADDKTPEVIHLDDRHSIRKILGISGSFFHLIVSGILFLTIAVLVYKQSYEYLPKSRFLLSAAVFAGCYGILFLREICVSKRIFAHVPMFLLSLLGILGCMELTVNALLTYSVFPFRDINYQESYISAYEPAVDYVKNMDAGLYRMEKTTSVTTNDPMLMNYSGICHDSSFHKFALQDFCDNLGLTSHGSIIHYDTNAALSTDCLLGVKYLIADRVPNSIYTAVYGDDVVVYQNPNVLPLMYLADAVKWNTQPADNQPFAYQNALFTAMTGSEDTVFKPCEDVVTVTEDPGEEESGHNILYRITAQNTEPMYAFFQADVPYAKLYVNDEEVTSLNVQDFDLYFNGLVSLGEHQPGEEIVIRLEPMDADFPLQEALFYYQDTAALASQYALLTANTPEITKLGNSKFTVDVEVGSTDLVNHDEPAQGSYLIFSVPYDKGWKVRVDGQKVDCVAAFDTLQAVPLTTGQHTITFSYVPRGFVPGILLTILSIGCLLAVIKFINTKEKENLL